ncbi:MAG: hypothetical protein ACHP6I_03930 [Rickettsiales bacterium]
MHDYNFDFCPMYTNQTELVLAISAIELFNPDFANPFASDSLTSLELFYSPTGTAAALTEVINDINDYEKKNNILLVALDYLLSDPVKIFIFASSIYQYTKSSTNDYKIGILKTAAMFGISYIGEHFKLSSYISMAKDTTPVIDWLQSLAVKSVTYGLAFNGVISLRELTTAMVGFDLSHPDGNAPTSLWGIHIAHPKKFYQIIGILLLEGLYIPLMTTNSKEMLESTNDLTSPLDTHRILVPTLFGGDPNGLNLELETNLIKSTLKATLNKLLKIPKTITSITSDITLKVYSNHLANMTLHHGLVNTTLVSTIKWGWCYQFFPKYTTDLHQFQSMQGCTDIAKLAIGYLPLSFEK